MHSGSLENAALAGSASVHAPSLAPAAAAPGRRAIVVGASSGIGAALVRALVRDGWVVAALARRERELQRLADALPTGRVIVRAHDAGDFAAVPVLFEALARELGGLDLVIYAAGIMPSVGPQEFDTRKDVETLAVNTGGCVAWCNEAARFFRSQRSGAIVGISSIAGERGRRPNPVYGASKAAVNHYLEALRNRLADHGVHVCTIKPGFVETAMVEQARAQGRNVKGAIPVDRAADLILDALRSRADERFVPRKWGLIAFVIRNIPSFLFKRMNV